MLPRHPLAARERTPSSTAHASLGVESQHVMGWIKPEPVWFFCPLFGDELEGGQAAKGLQSSGEVVGCDEVVQMRSQLLVRAVMVTPYGRFLDGPVPLAGRCLHANIEKHTLDLTVGSRVV